MNVLLALGVIVLWAYVVLVGEVGGLERYTRTSPEAYDRLMDVLVLEYWDMRVGVGVVPSYRVGFVGQRYGSGFFEVLVVHCGGVLLVVLRYVFSKLLNVVGRSVALIGAFLPLDDAQPGFDVRVRFNRRYVDHPLVRASVVVASQHFKRRVRVLHCFFRGGIGSLFADELLQREDVFGVYRGKRVAVRVGRGVVV